MKKLLVIFISIVTFIGAHAINVLDLERRTAQSSDTIPGYDLTIEKTDMSYTLTYSFSSIAMFSDEHTPNSCYLALNGKICDNLSIVVTPGTMSSVSTTIQKAVESSKQTIDIPNGNENLFGVRLLYENQEISSKTILRK